MKTVFNLLFCLFWLVSIPIIAQNNTTTSKKDGLTVVKIKTKEGTVTVNLPNNIYAGDIISGTVELESKRSTAKKKSKKEQKKEKEALEKLRKLNLSICETTTQISKGQFSFMVPKNVLSGVVEVKLSDDKMDPIAMTSFIVQTIPRALITTLLQVPNYLRSGYPQQIIGNFDGNFTTSLVSIDGKPIEIMAESPEAMIVAIPENMVGVLELEISENEFTYTTNINIVDLNLTADKMSLSRGESTTIHLEVLGLKNLEQPVGIHIDNLTPNSVSLSQGNHQELIIEPEMVNEQGVFTTDYQINAQQTGGFSISAQLQESKLQNADIPAPDEMNPAGPNADGKPTTEQEIKEADIGAPDEMNPAGPNAHEKPDNEQITKAEQPIPAPDALNPTGPNSDEKPTTEQEVKEGEIGVLDEVNPAESNSDKKLESDIGFKKAAIETLEEVSSLVIDNKQNENQANKKICGKIKTKWIEIRDSQVLQEGNHVKVRNSRSKCKKCRKYVNWTYYTTTYTIRVKVKRFVGECPLDKDHTGDHKGLKPEFDYHDRTTYKDRRIRTGCSDCGDLIKVGSKWKNLKKWIKRKEKKYKKS